MIAEFAYKVERARKVLDISVAGIFFTKTAHQPGAVKAGQCNGIETVVLEEGTALPGFNITFLRYDREREQRLRDITMHVAPGSYTVTGSSVNLMHGKISNNPKIP
jgi:hypothetical protein